jgi:hypothetical protein
MPVSSPFHEMRRLVLGYAISIAVSAVAELGIPDLLADGPKGAADLARRVGVDEDFLRRVLRYLASEGVLAERDGDSFALTPMSEWLRSDAPGSLRPRAVFVGSDISWTAWGKLLSAVRSGKSALEEAFGENLFEHVTRHPAAAASFNLFMAEQTAASVTALLAAYDFAGIRQLVDVGGGRGALVAGVLAAYPAMSGILFDMPPVVATAARTLAGLGVADRCQTVGGSFFDAVPGGADAYALKYILHDWTDADCVRILQNCREAMAPGGRILVIEHVVPSDGRPHFSRFMDLTMLALTPGGRERTESELVRLLEAADLRLQRSVVTPIDLCVLECVARPQAEGTA